MTTLREAALLALEAMEEAERLGLYIPSGAMKPIRDALEADIIASEREPFGYFRPEPFGWEICAADDEGAIALYENPQCTPLTDEEIDAIALELWDSVFLIPDGFHQCARAIERAHGIGGNK